MFPQIAVGSNEKAEPGVQTSAAAQLRAKDEGASTQALLMLSNHGASMESGWSASESVSMETASVPRTEPIAQISCSELL